MANRERPLAEVLRLLADRLARDPSIERSRVTACALHVLADQTPPKLVMVPVSTYKRRPPRRPREERSHAPTHL